MGSLWSNIYVSNASTVSMAALRICDHVVLCALCCFLILTPRRPSAYRFAMAIHFDQDISTWDVSNVSDMGYMFLHALEFDQDLSDWQVHNAFSLNSMFFGANKFNQDILQKWQISEHADTENMCEWNQQAERQQEPQEQKDQ